MSTITMDHCVETLTNKLRHTEFSVEKYNVTKHDAILGFCSNQFRLTIDALVREVRERFVFFVKCTTENPELNEKFWKVNKFFIKERMFLTEVMPQMLKHSSTAQVAELFCYDSDDFLIFEDLCTKGYEMSRIQTFDLKHACAVMTTLARFHASTIISERSLGLSWSEKYQHVFFETLLTFPEGSAKNCVFYGILKHIEYSAEKLVPHIDRITRKRILETATQRILTFCESSSEYTNVVCHGDVWRNNLMFKYNDQKDLIDAMLVDFQVIRYAPPALDLVHFLYTTATAEFRETHLSQLMDVYYGGLSDCLNQRGIDVDSVLPFDEFLESIDYYKEYGILVKLCYLTPRLPSQILVKMTKSQEFALNTILKGDTEIYDDAFKCDLNYKADVTESLEELFNYYIDDRRNAI